MAKLSFDVSAKWQEVQKLREEVEALKTALKDFNVAGDMKGFEELNKKYQESTQKLKEYEQQVQNYQRIIDQLNVSNGVMEGARQMASELNNATDVFVEQQLKVKALNEDVKKLNKSYLALSDIDKRGQKGSNILTELKEITHQYTIENEALKKLRKEYSDNIKIEGVAADSLVSLRKQLSLLNAEYDRLSASDRKAAIGTDLQKQIQSLNTEISAAEQATGRYQRNVGNYASAWNGLGMSVQQVARELPSLAIGWNTFFLAISNNLPMLADELKKASAEYKAFKAAVAAGNNDVAKVAPVWKQLISSIFSWQTALVVAITMLSVYGKDIIEWTKNLFGADTAQKRLNESLKEFNNLQHNASEKTLDEISKLNLLYGISQNIALSIDVRKKAVEKLQQMYPDYLQNLSEEAILAGKANEAYKLLVENIQNIASLKLIEDQRAKSAEALTEAKKKEMDLQSKINALMKENKAGNEEELVRNAFTFSRNYGNYIKNLIKSRNSAQKAQKTILDDIKKWSDQYANILGKSSNIEQLDVLFRDMKEYQVYKETIDQLNRSLSLSEITQEEYNRRINEAKGELIAAADAANIGGSALEKMRDEYVAFNKASIGKEQTEKQKKEAEKQKQVQERINNELLELQRRNEQSRIDLMEEGSDKRIAQIEYDYDREIEAIRKKEKEWREAQGGKLTQEQTVEIKTAVTQAKTTRMRSTQEVEYEQVEAQRKAMNDYLKEYGSYQEKKMALAVEYGQKIANAETEGEKLMLGKQWDKELLDLEIKTKNSSNAIIALFGDMRDKSLKELQELASKGQEALDFIKNGKWNATVGSKLGITEDEFRRWQEAPEAIRQAGESLRGVKDQAETLQPAFDKVTQGLKRFFAAGNDPKKLTESLQLINEGVNEVTSSVQFLSNSFRKLSDSFDISAFENIADSFDTIFDSISAGMEGAMSGEKIGELAASIGKKLGMVGEKAGAMFGPIGAAAGAAIGVVSSLASAIAKIHDKKNEKRIQKLQDQIDVLDASYEKLGRSIEKAYSTSAAQLISQQDELLKQQKILIQQQIKEEQNKKKTDDDRIKEWQKQLEDIDNRLEENKEKAVEAITGTDVMSAIDEFAQAYAEAWASGEDAAKSSMKIVQNLIKTAIINFLKDKLSPSVEEFMNKLADYMSDGIVSPWEEAELNKLKEKMDKEAQEIFENSGKWLKDESKYEQQATSGGFEVMSQDSANELNGRFTALQMIGEEILLYLQSSNQIANLLYISASIDSINIRIASLYDIADETRVMMANIYIELQQISDNTGDTVKQLKEVVSKLTKIENNTNNL
jgi:DNA repair exonuclease SbcCD ATPase subunit